MSVNDVYRPNVDYTLAAQVTSPVSAKTAFIPKYTPVDATGTAIPSGSTTAPMYVTAVKETTATTSSVPGAVADTSLLAANTNRLPGSTILNDSTAILYVLLGSGVASATNYTVAIDGKTTVGGLYVLPDGWVGAVRGIWASAVGNARVTELTA